MKTKYLGLMASVGLVCAPGLAAADGAAPAAPTGPSLSDVLVNTGITAAGYVDASYEAFLNSTDGATVPAPNLHEFDNNSNSFMLNQAALTLSYLPTTGFGALVNVIAGEDAKVINAAYNGTSGGGDFAVTQAYVQYANGPWTVIGGRYVTLAGAEVIDDTKNNNISRSLLFTNLEPLVHTGVRVAYKFGDQLTAFVGVNNTGFAFPTGVFTAIPAAPPAGADTNKQKTVEASLAYTPTSAIGLTVTDYYGVDGSGPTETKDEVLDVVGTYNITTALTTGFNLDYDRAINPTANGNAEGVAVYFADQFIDQLKGSLRAEFMRVGGEVGGGSGEGHVAELTATLDYTVMKNADVLGEVRDDYGSVDTGLGTSGIFASGAGTQKSQPEFLIKAIYKFGTPVPSS
jgi:putative OmpL-like beta-barrel porin-2